jgi:hypothetical protein
MNYKNKIELQEDNLKQQLENLEKQYTNDEITSSTYIRQKRKIEHELKNVSYTTTRLSRFVTITTLDKPKAARKKTKNDKNRVD